MSFGKGVEISIFTLNRSHPGGLSLRAFLSGPLCEPSKPKTTPLHTHTGKLRKGTVLAPDSPLLSSDTLASPTLTTPDLKK